jgi:hypothetical protein|uniref:Uncharacterized protein n=1 Tax=Siphoviridae sp. cteLh2 TaxID=2825590 RepID=A0A8S5U638_9CAUD|nr:hypothetical protein [uncultured Lachnoclostridium sp.]DAF89877.1 MAG TPA: hypothetical protein [Siphoviridae sp. cteLh2]
MGNLKERFKRKEIKCLVIEDFETGRIFKVVGEDRINKALEKYTANEITKVYNPDQKQKNKIFELMEISQKGKELVTTVDGVKMIINLIPLLTDIKIDLTSEDDMAEIIEIINDPNEVFELVRDELNEILGMLNARYINNLKVISMLPEDIIEKTMELQMQENDKIIENKTEASENNE